jgi:hypothetical protein
MVSSKSLIFKTSGGKIKRKQSHKPTPMPMMKPISPAIASPPVVLV